MITELETEGFLSIRYVRRWYADYSREVNPIARRVWHALTPAQQHILRFPVATPHGFGFQ
jgi:hypothetical protein